MKMDLVSSIDIQCGRCKLLLYKMIYLHHLKCGKKILCSGSVRIRCKEGRINIADNVKINSSVILHTTKRGTINIGEGTGLSHRVIIAAKEKINIGQKVMIGPNVCIYDHDHRYKTSSNMINSGFITGAIIIEDNVWIGANCVILRGSHIGTGSVIAAGSVVKGSIPANSIVYNDRKCIIRNKM